MALKLKLSKRQITIALVAALAVAALLVSRSGGGNETDNAGVLDGAASQACSDFASGYPKARTDTARLALADRLSASSRRTDNDVIEQRVSELGINADEGTSRWKASADALTKACRNAGWTAA